MLQDIVIDTNVLVDANNPAVTRFGDAVAFLRKLVSPGVRTDLKVDPGFSQEEARNRSRIISEYLDHISFGSLGSSVLVALLSSGRVKSVSSMPEHRIKRQVNQIVRNKTDRYFLCVAISSDERVLVSHDYVDFQSRKRVHINRKFGVDVVEAAHAGNRL